MATNYEIDHLADDFWAVSLLSMKCFLFIAKIEIEELKEIHAKLTKLVAVNNLFREEGIDEKICVFQAPQ